MFIDDITDHLTSIIPTTQGNLILGDFNIHIDGIQDTYAIAFKNTMLALGLDQCVNSSMHVHGSKLDLVFTEAVSNLTVSSCRTCIFLLDHKLVTPTLNVRKPKWEKKPVTTSKMKNVTFHTFQQELRSEKTLMVC